MHEILSSGADPEPPLPGGLVTNEAEGFTEARSAERGREERGDPLPLVGVRGSPPGNFGKFASKWCILSAFRGYLCTYLQLKIYIKNVSFYKHFVSNFLPYLREKGRDLPQSYDKSPYTKGNVKRAK